MDNEFDRYDYKADDTDLELIFSLGDELEKKCEHSQHNMYLGRNHSNGEVLYTHVAMCGNGSIKLFCKKFLDYAEKVNPPCAVCEEPLFDHYTILGPAL